MTLALYGPSCFLAKVPCTHFMRCGIESQPGALTGWNFHPALNNLGKVSVIYDSSYCYPLTQPGIFSCYQLPRPKNPNWHILNHCHFYILVSPWSNLLINLCNLGAFLISKEQVKIGEKITFFSGYISKTVRSYWRAPWCETACLFSWIISTCQALKAKTEQQLLVSRTFLGVSSCRCFR